MRSQTRNGLLGRGVGISSAVLNRFLGSNIFGIESQAIDLFGISMFCITGCKYVVVVKFGVCKLCIFYKLEFK